MKQCVAATNWHFSQKTKHIFNFNLMPNVQEGTNYLEYVAVMFCEVWLVPPHSTTLKFTWFVKDIWGCLKVRWDVVSSSFTTITCADMWSSDHRSLSDTVAVWHGFLSPTLQKLHQLHEFSLRVMISRQVMRPAFTSVFVLQQWR